MITPGQFQQALDFQASKVLLPTEAGTTELSDLPTEIRERSLFSARTSDAGYLADMDRLLTRAVSPAAAGEDAIDPNTVRAELKKSLQKRGYMPTPGEEGSLKDLSSDRRLNLIVKTNVEMAQGYGEFVKSQDPDILDLFPARELYRLESRKEERDWASRWVQAGGKIYGGRMIARVDDPIWTDISRFGNPYPPFDFNSGMWTRKISRKVAQDLGVIKRSTLVQQDRRVLNQQVDYNRPAEVTQGLWDAVKDALSTLTTVLISGDKITLDTLAAAAARGAL